MLLTHRTKQQRIKFCDEMDMFALNATDEVIVQSSFMSNSKKDFTNKRKMQEIEFVRINIMKKA